MTTLSRCLRYELMIRRYYGTANNNTKALSTVYKWVQHGEEQFVLYGMAPDKCTIDDVPFCHVVPAETALRFYSALHRRNTPA